MCVCVCVRTHARARVCVRVCVYVYVCMYMYVSAIQNSSKCSHDSRSVKCAYHVYLRTGQSEFT